MSHTKEPWAVLTSQRLVLSDHSFWHIVPSSFASDDGKPARGWGSHEIAEMNAGTTANPANDCGEANARRIVACVNACEGIANPSAIAFAVRIITAVAGVDLDRIAESEKDTFAALEHFSELAKTALDELKRGAT